MNIDDKIKKLLVKYLLKKLEKIFFSDDSNRLTLLFFVLSSLDLINCLNEIPVERKREIVEWVYRHQLHPSDLNDELSFKQGKFGFTSILTNCGPDFKYDYCNLAMTYCALVSLIILGDDLSRINRQAIIRGMREHQKLDGRFVQALIEEEEDLRITYCAATICYILQNWSSIDKNKMISYIKSCQSYENGFGQSPGNEAHCGSTFCAVASLYLMGQLSNVFTEKQHQEIAEWCLRRQVSGYQGRSHKDPDTCYSFWVGATLTFLNSFKFINDQQNCEFLQSTYDHEYGGFGKYPNTLSDILHTYFGLGALSLRVYNNIHTESNLQSIFPALNISERAYKHLQWIHSKWSQCSD